jgi:hypothetical protein
MRAAALRGGPVGENPIEARHFDETAMRAALLEVAAGERAAVFTNARGEPILEIWRVTPRATAPAPQAREERTAASDRSAVCVHRSCRPSAIARCGIGAGEFRPSAPRSVPAAPHDELPVCDHTTRRCGADEAPSA